MKGIEFGILNVFGGIDRLSHDFLEELALV